MVQHEHSQERRGSALGHSGGGEGAGPSGAKLHVVAAFPKAVEDLAVASGKRRVEVGSCCRRLVVEDGVDQAGPGTDGKVSRFHVHIGAH